MDARTLYSPIETLNPNPPCCVEVGTSVSDVIRFMQEGRFGCVLVIDKQQLAGIITERDLMVHVIGLCINPDDAVVDSIMTPSPETLTAKDAVAFALNLMHLGRYRHIPLLDAESGYPIGILSSKDVANHVARFLEAHKET